MTVSEFLQGYVYECDQSGVWMDELYLRFAALRAEQGLPVVSRARFINEVRTLLPELFDGTGVYSIENSMRAVVGVQMVKNWQLEYIVCPPDAQTPGECRDRESCEGCSLYCDCWNWF